MAAANLTAERARSMFRYDPETGLLWRHREGQPPRLPTAKANGYLVIAAAGKVESIHRLAWLMHYGEHPRFHIDHINGIKTDNRIANLRDVPGFVNVRNRRGSKLRMIGAVPDGDGWKAVVPDHDTVRVAGPFKTCAEAMDACSAELRDAVKTIGRRRRLLPKNVYAKHGSFYLVRKGKWTRLCRVDEGTETMLARKSEIDKLLEVGGQAPDSPMKKQKNTCLEASRAI